MTWPPKSLLSLLGVPEPDAGKTASLKASAEAGDARAQTNLGVAFATGDGVEKDMAEAVKWYLLAAEQNDAMAQANLGGIYARGVEGVPKDEARAVRYLTLAAEQNSPVAQFNLGVLYDYGHGVAEDETQALNWYEKAAGGGHATAQYTLGFAYLGGQGRPKDIVKAHVLFALALALGFEKAEEGIELARKEMTTEQLEEATQIFHDRRQSLPE